MPRLGASIFSFAQTGDESTFIYLDGKMNREDLENILDEVAAAGWRASTRCPG